jgi:hypothetical protein
MRTNWRAGTTKSANCPVSLTISLWQSVRLLPRSPSQDGVNGEATSGGVSSSYRRKRPV